MTKLKKAILPLVVLLCGVLTSYCLVASASPFNRDVYAYIGAFTAYAGNVWLITVFLQGVMKGYERAVLKKHGIIPEVEPVPSWTSTDMETGAGREMLEIEVPPEVRRWAKDSNDWLNGLFDRQGAMCVVIGAVPNTLAPEDRNEYTQMPFHMTYTMSKNMNPILFTEMVNSFNRQLPALFASQEMDADIEFREDDHE